MFKKIEKNIIAFMRISFVIFIFAASGFLMAKTVIMFSPPRNADQSGCSQQKSSVSKQGDGRIVSQASPVLDIEDKTLEILSILAVLGGVVSYVFRDVVKKEIYDRNKEVMGEQEKADTALREESRKFTEAQSLKVSGVLAYNRFLLYRDAKIKKELSAEAILRMLNKAIKDTKAGLLIMSRMDGDLRRNQLLDCVLKNNFAWFYVEKWLFLKNLEKENLTKDEEIRDCESAKKCVMGYVDHTYSKARFHGEHEKAWVDTYVKVNDDFLK